MNQRGKPSLSEIKVGIFVLITCVILGAAIFTIGTQVGLFEATFYAKTYLNNVSGLKPGDLVLLAGVEVGNVASVEVTRPDQPLPDTQTNRQLLSRIEELSQLAQQLAQRIRQTEEQQLQARERYLQAVETYGENSQQARREEQELQSVEGILESQLERLEDIREDIDRAHRNLQNIEVVMQIQSQYRDWIRRDSNISLGSIGLLGDKYVDISLGRSPNPPLVLDEKMVTWWGTDTREVVVITGTTQPGFQELITGADDVLVNLESLSDRLNDVLFRISEGEGTMGRFLTDPSFYNNLNETVVQANQTVEEATRLVNELRSGPGTVGRLVQDDQVYVKIRNATTQLEKLLARVDQGEGTLGRLFNDPSIYETSDKMVGNLERITHRIETGQGTLGRLTTEEELYQDLQQSLDRFSTFMSEIEQGRGTLGRLAKDEKLYQNINEASSEIVKLLYDFRQNPRKFLTIKLDLF